jgi:hypothetical protein
MERISQPNTVLEKSFEALTVFIFYFIAQNCGEIQNGGFSILTCFDRYKFCSKKNTKTSPAVEM